jgi:hypothetical protein
LVDVPRAARFSSKPAGKAAGMSERQVVAMHMPHRSERAEQARSDLADALPLAEHPSLPEHWRARR